MKNRLLMGVAILIVIAIAILGWYNDNQQIKIPTKELAYMQLDTKGEEFVLNQIEGCTRMS